MKTITRAVSNRRLLKLAGFLAKLPRKRFNYATWVGVGWKGKPDLSCGTEAGALGWATTIPSFRKQGLRLYPSSGGFGGYPAIKDEIGKVGYLAGAWFFGLSVDDATHLFAPGLAEENVPPKYVAEKIRKFVAGRLGPLEGLLREAARGESVVIPGTKYDNSKPRWSLIPRGVVRAVVDILEHGAKKYSPNNWVKVPEARTRYYDAAMRHIEAWWNGELRDAESGGFHLAHAMCCLSFLLAFDLEAEKVKLCTRCKGPIPNSKLDECAACMMEPGGPAYTPAFADAGLKTSPSNARKPRHRRPKLEVVLPAMRDRDGLRRIRDDDRDAFRRVLGV